MLKIDPTKIALSELGQYLKSVIAPRPIAFVSTVDKEMAPNLAPYSFFNLFSINPPIVVFSSSRKADNSVKDTLTNVRSTGEAVINVVSYNFVRQMAITSIEFDKNTNEFLKSGLTPIESELVSPFRVAESPVQLECKVEQIIPLGAQEMAGHLVVCKILLAHISPDILGETGKVNPHKIDLMGRMGRAFYVRASGESIYTIFQPTKIKGIGYDALPASIRHSHVLTANNIGQISGIQKVPTTEELALMSKEPYVVKAIQAEAPLEALHDLAQKALDKEHVLIAARILWLADQLYA